jgi:hypothetical protein
LIPDHRPDENCPVPDDVWPLGPGEPGPLGSFNGIGFTMRGFTRTDTSGRCFATRWFVMFLLPVIPLARYYVTEGATTPTAASWTTRYQLHGRSRLRAGEVLRTYVFCWLVAPGIVLVPIILWLTHADQIADATSFWVVLVVFLVLVLGGVALVVTLISVYRRRWAPLRTVRWLDARPG